MVCRAYPLINIDLATLDRNIATGSQVHVAAGGQTHIAFRFEAHVASVYEDHTVSIGCCSPVRSQSHSGVPAERLSV